MFVEWVFRLARVQDVPSLYSVMVKSWLTLSPLGSKGATRQPLPALVFLVSHLALTVGRCRAALKHKRWPPWFQQLWKTFPSEHRAGIASADFGWFSQLVQWAQGQGGHSAVYSLYSHSGLYVGKANLLRKNGARRGHAERLIEHVTGLLIPSSQDGNLPRYKVLRSSSGSIGFFPLRVFDNELRTLAAERALIVELKPSANGADWAALQGTRKHGRLLHPLKARRQRHPPAVRKSGNLDVPIWDQLHFTQQKNKLIQLTRRRMWFQSFPSTSSTGTCNSAVWSHLASLGHLLCLELIRLFYLWLSWRLSVRGSGFLKAGVRGKWLNNCMALRSCLIPGSQGLVPALLLARPVNACLDATDFLPCVSNLGWFLAAWFVNLEHCAAMPSDP